MSLAFVLLDSQCTHEQCRLLVPAICARGSGQAVTLASKTNAVNQAAVLHIPCPRVISSYVSHNGPAVSAYRAPLGDVEVHKTKLPPPKTMGFNLLFACGRGEFRVLLSRCVDHNPPSGVSPGLLVLLSVYCRVCFFYPSVASSSVLVHLVFLSRLPCVPLRSLGLFVKPGGSVVDFQCTKRKQAHILTHFCCVCVFY